MTWAGTPAWGSAVGLYLIVGAVVGILLVRAGQPRSTGLAALAAWPMLVGLVGVRAGAPAEGPMASAIARAFRALDELLDQQRSQGASVAWSWELGALRQALETADARLAVADRILEDLRPAALESVSVAEDLAALGRARQRAAAELQAVLGGVHRLRIQVGLLALSEIQDEAASAVRQHLHELHARARAIEEISTLGAPLSRASEPAPP